MCAWCEDPDIHHSQIVAFGFDLAIDGIMSWDGGVLGGTDPGENPKPNAPDHGKEPILPNRTRPSPRGQLVWR